MIESKLRSSGGNEEDCSPCFEAPAETEDSSKDGKDDEMNEGTDSLSSTADSESTAGETDPSEDS